MYSSLTDNLQDFMFDGVRYDSGTERVGGVVVQHQAD
jgi:hypothetical protein